MPDTDDFIGVRSILDDNDSTEFEYTQSDTVGGKKVHKRIVKLLDDVSALVTDGVLVASVLDAAPGASEPGLVVRIAGGAAGDGAILDGVTSTIRATVRDYANSDPLAVALTDASGDVYVAGGGTQYAEDTPHVTGDSLTLAGVVQQSADSALSDDGDRSLMQVDASGFLKVNVKAGSAGGTEYTEDAALPGDPAGGILIARRADTPAATVDADGDAIAVNATDKGELYVKHLDSVAITAAALPLPAGAATEATLATLLLEATFTTRINTQGQKAMAASTPVVIASDQSTLAISAASLPLPASAAQEHATAASPHSVRLSTGAAFYDAPTGAQLPAALVGGRLDANVGAWLGATTPTVGQKAMAASIPVVVASDQTPLEVEGDAAHDAAIAGNPVRIGARANANEPTAVDADNDTVDLWADRLGRLVTIDGHPTPGSPATVSVTTTNVEILAAPGASLSLYIKRLLVTNRAATENVLSLKEGSGGTIRTTLNCAADGGGAVIDYGTVGWKIAANTALNADAGASSIDVNVLEYYIAA